MQRTYVVILAGGTGSRLWPASKSAKPKQFLDVLGLGQTMLQLTFARFSRFIPESNILVVTNRAYSKWVKEQLPYLPDNQIVREPIKKNTAAAVAYAMFRIWSLDPGATVVLSPGDNMIFELDKFQLDIEQGISFVRKHDSILTLGIRPNSPDVHTGYIQFVPSSDPLARIHKVKTFIEKPTEEFANTFFRSGEFLKYTGHMIWKVEAIIKLFQLHMPDLYEAFMEKKDTFHTEQEQPAMEQVFSFIENMSFRTGVLYKAANVKVMECNFGWTDLTVWNEVWEAHEKDYVGNAVKGSDVVMYDSSNCLVRVPEEKLVILKDLDNYIVLDTSDVLVICPIDKEHEIKSMLAASKKIKIERYL